MQVQIRDVMALLGLLGVDGERVGCERDPDTTDVLYFSILLDWPCLRIRVW